MTCLKAPKARMNSAKVGVLASIIQYKVWQSSRGGGAEHGLLVAADVCDMCDTHSTCSSSSSSSRLWNYSLCKSTATCWILNKSLHESAARSQSILNFFVPGCFKGSQKQNKQDNRLSRVGKNVFRVECWEPQGADGAILETPGWGTVPGSCLVLSPSEVFFFLSKLQE